jgi:hypothetical protein
MNRCCIYLLPIRRTSFCAAEAEDLSAYFAGLQGAGCEVIVIDGSPGQVFARHHDKWSGVCQHVMVDPRFRYLNDKVNGVHTGISLTTTEKIILADDDIRYRPGDVEKICALLEQFEVVRPQNYLATRWIGRSAGDVNQVAASPPCLPLSSPQDESVHLADRKLLHVLSLPWWARTEAARMLINRATLRIADYPGTCAFRRSTILNAGEYDGDVLFDNEEIIRHFARRGSRICYANNFFIHKRPPKFRKWLEQRPRQAYEDFGLRFKTIVFASLLPIAFAITLIGGMKSLSIFALSIAVISILLAFTGRARGSARRFFPLTICLFAPVWILERTLSTYCAFYWLLIRGGYPFGDRILKKGMGRDWIKGGKIAAAASRE